MTATSTGRWMALTGTTSLALILSWAPPAHANPADELLEVLRATDQLRQTDTAETQAWEEEKARLELLLSTVGERITAAKGERRKAQAKLQELQSSAPVVPDAALETGAVVVAQRIHGALDSLARSVPPGLIPPRGPRRAEPRDILDDALHRLEKAERGVSTVAVSIAPGWLDGEPRSVEVMRLGGVAAWWQTLDGTEGGEASMTDGQLRLHKLDDPTALDAIRRASAIAKGRRAPEITILPVRFARTSTGSTP